MKRHGICFLALFAVLALQALWANDSNHILVGLHGDVATIDLEKGQIDWLVQARDRKKIKQRPRAVEEAAVGLDEAGSVTLALLHSGDTIPIYDWSITAS